jgi:AN1-like Zinc finger
MARCDHCGKAVTLPFSCQYCGGKFCDECRLPPNHTCENIGMWKKKPLPSVGLSYSKGGGVTATGSGYHADSRREKQENPHTGFPWPKVIIAIMVIIILFILFLVIIGYLLLKE